MPPSRCLSMYLQGLGGARFVSRPALQGGQAGARAKAPWLLAGGFLPGERVGSRSGCGLGAAAGAACALCFAAASSGHAEFVGFAVVVHVGATVISGRGRRRCDCDEGETCGGDTNW